MAITIINQPNVVSTVYNEHWLTVTSSNLLQSNFSFVFDIYLESTLTSKIARFKVPVYPNTVYGYLNPMKTLEKYLTSDRNLNELGIATAGNSIKHYIIQIGEEFGSLTTGTTIYPNLSTVSGYSFNGVAQYEDLANGYYSPYISTYILSGSALNPPNCKFLTEKPYQSIPIQVDERETLGWLNTNNQVNYIKLTTYQITGGTREYYISNANLSGITTDDRRLMTVGVGIPNLLEIPNNVLFIKSGLTLVSTSQPIIDGDNDYKWSIQAVEPLFISSDVEYSFSFVYELYDNCGKYDTIRLMFLNRHGQFDYYSFNKVSRKTITTERKTYNKLLTPYYSLGSAGKTVYDTSGSIQMVVNTDYINEETGDWLVWELLNTKEAYEVRNGNELIPIIINTNSLEELAEVNGIPIQYQFSYTYANDIRGQRG